MYIFNHGFGSPNQALCFVLVVLHGDKGYWIRTGHPAVVAMEKREKNAQEFPSDSSFAVYERY